MADQETVSFEAAPQDEGGRADVVIARALEISRSRAAALIHDGRVRAEGVRKLKVSTPVHAGQRFECPLPERSPRGATAEAEAIPLLVVYEDEELLVIDKPAGMVVHPAPGHARGTLVNALLAHLNRTPDPRLEALRPGIVHRLDRDTSGLMVVAKTFEAHEHLARQIRERRAQRVYLALTLGRWPSPEGVIEGMIGRSPANRKKMAVVESGGRPARTRYRVLRSLSPAELVEARLETGRTHQIRVHFAARGHPVLGDPLYGGRIVLQRGFSGLAPGRARALLEAIDRQALHAARLAFDHPRGGQRLEFESPLPPDMQRLLQLLEEHPTPEREQP